MAKSKVDIMVERITDKVSQIEFQKNSNYGKSEKAKKYSWTFVALTKDKTIGYFVIPNDDGEVESIKPCLNYLGTDSAFRAITLTDAKVKAILDNMLKIDMLMKGCKAYNGEQEKQSDDDNSDNWEDIF